MKARKVLVFNILVPPPPLIVSSEIVSVFHTQQSAAVQNCFSMLTGNDRNNNISSLEEEMTTVVTLKMPKRQHLMNNDCGDAINKFAENYWLLQQFLYLCRIQSKS